MPRRVFYDTEFLDDGRTIELISIGMVDEDGREFYAVNQDAPWKRIAKHQWLCENVARHLPRIHGDRRFCVGRSNPLAIDFDHRSVMSRALIAEGVREFILDRGPDVELWAYFGAYDHVVLAQLFGTMMGLPDGVPMFTHELMQFWHDAGCPDKPAQSDREHNALADARWNLALWRACGDRP